MERNIVVEKMDTLPFWKRDVEMVERKGIGHPDTLADGIAESVSVALCKEYLRKYGVLMHHNTDQCEVVGGEVHVHFGGGEILKPIRIILSGRATAKINDEYVPVHEIAMDATREFLGKSLPNLNVDNEIVIESVIGSGSADLVNVFKRKDEVPLANDTSFGVGFAPYTELERLVLDVEQYLNSKDFKGRHPYVGEDIKVMGLRTKNTILLTVAAAFISKHVNSASEYLDAKAEVLNEIKEHASGIVERAEKVEVFLNTADNENGTGPSDFYLTLTGTSAEQGDDGSVGRGNRVSGLITPYRPMSMEAAAGKNPYNHVGKIYNVLSFKIANRVVDEVGGVDDVVVRILSQIGRRIDYPKIASVDVWGSGYDEDRIRKIVDEELATITEITKEIIEGKHRLY